MFSNRFYCIIVRFYCIHNFVSNSMLVKCWDNVLADNINIFLRADAQNQHI